MALLDSCFCLLGAGVYIVLAALCSQLLAFLQVAYLLGFLHSCKAPALAGMSEIQVYCSTDENLSSKTLSTEKKDTFWGERRYGNPAFISIPV